MIKFMIKMSIIPLLFMPMAAFAHMAEKGNFQVIHPWADAGLIGDTITVHPTFMNNDEEKYSVISGAQSSASESVRFVKDGVVIDAITVEPSDILSDEDVSVELVNLKQDLAIGDLLSMTLHFDDGTKLQFKLGVGQETMPE
jgi:copper(I)-binding protein